MECDWLTVLELSFSRFDSVRPNQWADWLRPLAFERWLKFLVVFLAVRDDGASGFPLDDFWLWRHDSTFTRLPKP